MAALLSFGLWLVYCLPWVVCFLLVSLAARLCSVIVALPGHLLYIFYTTLQSMIVFKCAFVPEIQHHAHLCPLFR